MLASLSCLVDDLHEINKKLSLIELSEKSPKTYQLCNKELNKFACMFLSCHIRVSEWIYTLYLPECQGTPCSKQARYLKFKWLQRDLTPQPLSS